VLGIGSSIERGKGVMNAEYENCVILVLTSALRNGEDDRNDQERTGEDMDERWKVDKSTRQQSGQEERVDRRSTQLLSQWCVVAHPSCCTSLPLPPLLLI
jgi:hypothetical protein